MIAILSRGRALCQCCVVTLMTLCATGRHVRAVHLLERTNDLRCPSHSCICARYVSNTTTLRVDVVKGANRPGGRQRKRDFAKLKAAKERDDWDDDYFSTLEESVGGPGVHNVEDGPHITKIGLTKPRTRPKYSQFVEPAAGEEENGQSAHAMAGDLPLPPFMRDKKKSRRFDKWYKNGTYAFDKYDKQKLKETRAPFATAFAQNPWAQMLATPMRQDAYTGARLPKACLLDFHLADDVANDRAKLLPLGLAAALLNKKRKWSHEEREIRNLDRKQNAVVPEGVASYVMMRKEALDFVSQDPRRSLKRVIGFRMQQTMDTDQIGGQLEWREDMGEVVLKSLRKIVRKKLREAMLLREVATKGGVITALSNEYKMAGLDDVDNVGCVVQLKLSEQDEDARPKRIPEPKDPMRSHFWPNSTSFLGDTYGEWDLESPAIRWAKEDAERVASREPSLEEAPTQHSTTQNLLLEHWSREDKQGSPFLGHCLPLPPPNVPTTWYYPTVRYRTQRIPLYDLARLLGHEEMRHLLTGTVFEEVQTITICQPWVSAELQIWLFKLQMFMASTKEETQTIM